MSANRAAPKTNDSTTRRTRSKNNLDALLFAKRSDVEMKNAVLQIGPKIYNITDIKDEEVRFIVFGCQGAGNNDQKSVANLINKIKTEIKPHFYLILGDNVYDWGASSPSDQVFKELFEEFYNQFSPDERIPGAFIILGNHDGNYQALANRIRSGNPTGQETEINEAAHTYSNQNNINTFRSDNIPFNKIPLWSMPYYFYGLDIGDNLRMFCLNSNSFLKDFHELFHLLGLTIPDDPKMKDIFRKTFLQVIESEEFEPEHPIWRNQAYWTFKNYHEAKKQGKTIHFAQHNPLQTVGKRADPDNFDSKYYESKEEKDHIKNITGLKSYSQGKLLNAAYQFLGFNDVDMLSAAHDHNINLMKPAGLVCRHQFISGGGGGKLDGIDTFRHHSELLCHLKQHGIGVMSVNLKDPRQFKLDIHTLQGLHLRYDSQQERFIQQEIIGKQLKALIECIDHATKNYFMKKRQSELAKPKKDENVDNDSYIRNTLWGAKAVLKKVNKSVEEVNEAIEVETAQNLSAYSLQYKLSDFDSAKDYFIETIQGLATSHPESELISTIKNELKAKEELIKTETSKEKQTNYSDLFNLRLALTLQTMPQFRV